jgi:hypothetical protein
MKIVICLVSDVKFTIEIKSNADESVQQRIGRFRAQIESPAKRVIEITDATTGKRVWIKPEFVTSWWEV